MTVRPQSEMSTTRDMIDGERVEVQRYGDDEWYAGTVVRASKMWVEMDAYDAGRGPEPEHIADENDIWDWRPLADQTPVPKARWSNAGDNTIGEIPESDRELLELAAKAAGFASVDFLAGDGFANVYDADGRQSTWNPLTDDGDALRLLVKLRLDISSEHDQVSVLDQRETLACELYGSDANAATRRAITRAAAEIGRRMR